MNKNFLTIIVLILVCVVMFAIIAFEEMELRNLKAEIKTAQETVTTLQTENANLTEEMNAQKRRTEEAEQQLTDAQTTQQYYSYNYHDSDYDGMSAKDYIAQRESGGDYEARNGQYYGKYQLQIDMLGGDLSPENQEETAERTFGTVGSIPIRHIFF